MEICFDTCQMAKLKTVLSEQQKDMPLVTFSSIPSTHAVPKLVFPGDWIHIVLSQLENPKHFVVSMYRFKPAKPNQSLVFMPHAKCLDCTSTRTPPFPTPSFTQLECWLCQQLAGFKLHYLLP